ncbi:hypothetical protein INT47_010350 [Mucor saturninus]|uniref:CCHC-type domain-containing protein n=1 Tax=Mucor saturninus TaxID=64648 RepID=A0A8H7QHD8_9FUNG|nr:hypothetical protein INT47_010350 [Mucor saturninus]
MMRQAASIVKQALTPGSVLFSLPSVLFQHRSDAYKLIEEQCGAVQAFRPISNYSTRSAGEIMVEVKFKQATSSPSIPSGNNTFVHMKMNFVRIPDQETFLADLKRSLRYYGVVYQVKEYTCAAYFEGELSVILDISVSYIYGTGAKVKNELLPNDLYLQEWDCFAAATFKAKTKCFSCHDNGHIAKFCKKKKTSDAVDVVEELPDSSAPWATVAATVEVVSDSDTDIFDVSVINDFVSSGSAA